ncbi:hypothetical protein E2C01_042214 [Portunus trituberculatus]|uniref:Uncharacterized protein n=1 Tax=Portunus trituberculatus TaxID=210409 RepID=A0A5B7FLW0_PORTR|nr:hypothetical protein [Portunus trituberculatus]
MSFPCKSEFCYIKRWNTQKYSIFDIFHFLRKIVWFAWYSEFCCIKRWNTPK